MARRNEEMPQDADPNTVMQGQTTVEECVKMATRTGTERVWMVKIETTVSSTRSTRRKIVGSVRCV